MLDERNGFYDMSRERALLYKSAFESANDVIIYYHSDPKDPRGPRILHANRKFVEETGYSIDEAVGRYSDILFGPLTNMRAIESNRVKLYRGEPTVSDMCKYRKDGQTYWTEASVYPLADHNGQFSFWISIERNITARREMDDHLRLFKLALESAGDMIVINDVGTDPSVPWNVVYVNAAFEAMTGYDRSELDTLAKVWGPNPDTAQQERTRKSILAGEKARVEYPFYRRNGEQFLVQGVVEPVLGEDDRPIHAISIYREVVN